MRGFRARAITLRGRVVVGGSVEEAFPLFSPEGERRWVPGWEPELLHPPGVEWVQGLIFRTREQAGDAVWIVTRLDRASHHVEYHRVEPGRYVARIEVSCRAVGRDSTEAAVAYSFIGLSDAGNQEIGAMTQEAYDAKMARWASWINRSEPL